MTEGTAAGSPASALLTRPHDVRECESNDHCWIHNVDEPMTVESFRFCFECGHVFATAEELVRKHFATVGEPLDSTFDPAKVYSCPECAHDF